MYEGITYLIGELDGVLAIWVDSDGYFGGEIADKDCAEVLVQADSMPSIEELLNTLDEKAHRLTLDKPRGM